MTRQLTANRPKGEKMKLIDLIDCKKEFSDIEITGVTCDSRVVKEGYAFVCIKLQQKKGSRSV